jgi:thymidylate kinase
MKELFGELNQSDISYFVWKDTFKAKKFFEGNCELDLLVNNNEKPKFEKIIIDYDFIPLAVVDKLKIKDINHYIKFIDGKYFHLHVYYDLITGNHYTKEYRFIIEESLFENVMIKNGVKVVTKEAEIAFLALRLFIKDTTFFKNLKISEQMRLKELTVDYNLSEVSKIIAKISPNIKCLTSELIKITSGVKSDLKSKNIITKKLKDYKKTDGLRLAFSNLRIRIILLVLRIKKSSNKVIDGNGYTCAILGSDGSGKTTIANKLFKQYSAKTSCKRLYLGGNSKTYSIITRMYFFNYYLTKITSPIKERFYPAWFLYYNAVTLLELGKAKDRRVKIIRGNKLKNKGWIILFERFPIVGLFDFPNNLIGLKSHKYYSKLFSGIIRHRIDRIAQIIENLEKPDTIFLIKTDLENMKNRRNLTPNEIADIIRKLDLQEKYCRKNDSLLVVINNNSSMEKAIQSINIEVNKKLCSFNS